MDRDSRAWRKSGLSECPEPSSVTAVSGSVSPPARLEPLREGLPLSCGPPCAPHGAPGTRPHGHDGQTCEDSRCGHLRA